MTKLAASDVEQYLIDHPEFFAEHPEPLKHISIPHECGSAISLVQYQLQVLRDDNKHLNKKLIDLIQVARDNDLLAERMHRLTVDVMQCRNIEELVPTVQDLLRDKFGVDIVHFRLFNDDQSGPEQLGYRNKDDEGWSLFQDITDNGRINLGAVTPDEGAFLFGEDKDQVSSCAVLPLQRGKVYGILGLGSFAGDRFTRQMGTVYLQQMASVISQAVANFAPVKQEQASTG